jgi:hypothetical protein
MTTQDVTGNASAFDTFACFAKVWSTSECENATHGRDERLSGLTEQSWSGAKYRM